MHIGPPQIQQDGDTSVLSAEVDIDTDDAVFPSRLEFILRRSDPSFLSRSGDAFLIALLPVAMRLGEPIRTAGPVSMRLAHGVMAYQDILSTWFPRLFRQIPINYDLLDSRRPDQRPEGVGCTFSGGVDSYFFLRRETAPRQAIPDYQLTHALMINGFDQIVDETGTGYILDMERIYRPVLAEYGVELVILKSNVKHFRDPVFPKNVLLLSFNSPLLACVHAIGRLFGRFTLAGHSSYADLTPIGAHPILDHHLSTDQLEIMHGGAAATRSERIAQLAEVPAFVSTVRVCVREPRFDPTSGAIINCCECEKCIRTMITLDILGILDRFPTFPRKNAINDYKNPDIFTRHAVTYLIDNHNLALSKQRTDWSSVLEKAIRAKQRAKRGLRF